MLFVQVAFNFAKTFLFVLVSLYFCADKVNKFVSCGTIFFFLSALNICDVCLSPWKLMKDFIPSKMMVT